MKNEVAFVHGIFLCGLGVQNKTDPPDEDGSVGWGWDSTFPGVDFGRSSRYVDRMTLVLDIPDEMIHSLGDSPDARSRCAREAIAVHLYREGRISLRALGALVGVGNDYWSAEAFRIRHQLPLSVAGCAEDDEAISRLRKGA
jgi:hypothetical protein